MSRQRRQFSAARSHPIRTAAIVTTTTVEDSRTTSDHVFANPTVASANPPAGAAPAAAPSPAGLSTGERQQAARTGPALHGSGAGSGTTWAPGEIRASTLCGQTSPIAGEARP